jgi:hypothetical protein
VRRTHFLHPFRSLFSLTGVVTVVYNLYGVNPPKFGPAENRAMRRLSQRTIVLPWLLFFVFPLLLDPPPSRSQSRSSDLASYDALIDPAHCRHWAFEPVRRPPIPRVKNQAWICNPIDDFVLAGLEARGWQAVAACRAAQPAEPRSLLRRRYLDLIGLPPTADDDHAAGGELGGKLLRPE